MGSQRVGHDVSREGQEQSYFNSGWWRQCPPTPGAWPEPLGGALGRGSSGTTPHSEKFLSALYLKFRKRMEVFVTVVVQSLSRAWLCDPMDCSSPGFPSQRQFTQTHVHWVGDAIQSSLPVVPSPTTFNLFQNQVFFLIGQFVVWFKMFSEAKIATANIPNLKIPISPDIQDSI